MNELQKRILFCSIPRNDKTKTRIHEEKVLAGFGADVIVNFYDNNNIHNAVYVCFVFDIWFWFWR